MALSHTEESICGRKYMYIHLTAVGHHETGDEQKLAVPRTGRVDSERQIHVHK